MTFPYNSLYHKLSCTVEFWAWEHCVAARTKENCVAILLVNFDLNTWNAQEVRATQFESLAIIKAETDSFKGPFSRIFRVLSVLVVELRTYSLHKCILMNYPFHCDLKSDHMGKQQASSLGPCLPPLQDQNHFYNSYQFVMVMLSFLLNHLEPVRLSWHSNHSHWILCRLRFRNVASLFGYMHRAYRPYHINYVLIKWMLSFFFVKYFVGCPCVIIKVDIFKKYENVKI